MKKSTQLVPAFASTLLSRMAVGVGVLAAGIGITSAVLPQPASAQNYDRVEPLEGLTPQNEYGVGESRGFDPLDLMHRAQTGGFPDFREFSDMKRRELGTAADAFREEQRRRLQQSNPQQVSPENSPENSATEPPKQ